MAAIVSRLTTAARSLENADPKTIRRTDSEEKAGESKDSIAGIRFLKNLCIHSQCHPSPQMNAAVVAA
jgi:hypothetical protein